MTDKVQKIKDWISREQDGLMDAPGNFEYPEHEGAYHILCNLDTYIDSLQEEPTGNIWHNPNEKPCYDKPFAIVSDGGELTATFTYFSNEVVRGGLDWEVFNKRYHIAKWCYIEDLYNNEEPVSEGLEEASKNYALNNTPWDDCADEMQEAFKAGANWKDKQMMEKAIDVKVKVDAGDYPYIPQMELYDYDKDIPLAKAGEKYKVVLIKED